MTRRKGEKEKRGRRLASRDAGPEQHPPSTDSDAVLLLYVGPALNQQVLGCQDSFCSLLSPLC